MILETTSEENQLAKQIVSWLSSQGGTASTDEVGLLLYRIVVFTEFLTASQRWVQCKSWINHLSLLLIATS